MNVDTARELLRYNTWANKRLLGAVSGLDADRFTRVLGGSYPSVQATLTHLVWAEWLWVRRWQGLSPRELFVPGDFPSVADIATRLTEVQAAQLAFVEFLVPQDLQKLIRYTNRQGEVWEYALWRMIYHLFNHSTYHRGQVTNMLRVLDRRPASTDFLEFWDEGD
jgi:uncharacterized damage-inducible protein DinB